MPKPSLAIYGIQDRADLSYPWFVHDHAIAIMQDGEVIKHLQLERISRKKRDNNLHKELFGLLKKEKLLNTEFDLIFVDNVVGRSFITSGGEIRFETSINDTLQAGAELGKCWWLKDSKKASILNHELAHLFSCLPFYGEFKENSLLIHFDGGASLSNFSAWHWINGDIKPVEYHWDLKYLSSFFNANALSFAIIGARIKDQNAVPGKLMGYAAFGNYSLELELWLKENNYFENIWKDKKPFFSKLEQDFGIQLSQFDGKKQILKDIAATFQHVFQRELVKKIRQLQRLTSTEYLYYAGGSALNIPSNSAIQNGQIFKDVFIPPCTDDSGLALGAAAFLEFQKHSNISVHSPYLNNWGVENSSVHFTNDLVKETAGMLMKSKIIGISNGPSEIGPRALGNRSILALPNSKELARTVSIGCKGREWYRPVAPVMLEKNASLVTGNKHIHHLSKYMLLNFDIIPEYQHQLSGVTHVDGTSRIQTIFHRDENPFIYDLLLHLDNKHNIPALINTSFNQRGEPIVHRPADALKSAKQMKLDAVIINGSMYKLK